MCLTLKFIFILFSDFTTMQTREQGMKNNTKRRTVEGQHHQCGAALVKGEVKNKNLSKGIQCEKCRGCQD